MYQVLYRKWRPQTFDDVAGQPQVTVTLKNEFKSGRINHAYLFTGSRGTGKTTCAKILAKAVNCLDLYDGNPCGKCDNCVGIDNGNILDVIEMDAASNRRIDDIRSIIDEAQFTPAKAKYRVYIIDEVHMLTTEAFNALLKTLEEPPKHVVFILATTEIHKLPATILSRCQRFDFHRIAPEDIANRIKFVANEEKVTITDEAAMLAAGLADGALRDALSLLDRCIGLSSEITAQTVREAAGLAGKDHLFELVNCCINKNTAKALEIIDTLYKESKDMARLCDELTSHFRSLMLIKTCKKPRQMLVMSDDEFETTQTQSDYMTLAEIVYCMDILQRSYARMGKGTNNRTEFEMAVVKLSSPELDGTTEALLNRISTLEKAVNKGLANISVQNKSIHPALTTIQTENSNTKKEHSQSSQTLAINQGDDNQNKVNEQKADTAPEQTIINPVEASNKPVKQPTAKKTQTPATTATVAAADPSAQPPVRFNSTEEIYATAVPFTGWVDVINNLKNYSRTIAASFEGTRAYTSGDFILIESESQIPFKLMQQSAQKEKIRVAIQEVTGKIYRLGPYKKPQQKKEQADPLLSLVSSLKENGVNIIEENKENDEDKQ